MKDESVEEKETPDTKENLQEEEIPEAREETEDAKEEKDKEDVKEESKEKKKGKEKKKDKKQQQIEELQDKLIRQMAEFDNFRKRSEKEKAQMFDIGAKDIIERILPVVDNFERGLGTLTEEEKDSAFAQGIEKIYKQLVDALKEAGVVPIDAVGKEFDPNLHNAVMHAEDDELDENIVSDEFQKGYMYHDTVVRHSMVKVVN